MRAALLHLALLLSRAGSLGPAQNRGFGVLLPAEAPSKPGCVCCAHVELLAQQHLHAPALVLLLLPVMVQAQAALVGSILVVGARPAGAAAAAAGALIRMHLALLLLDVAQQAAEQRAADRNVLQLLLSQAQHSGDARQLGRGSRCCCVIWRADEGGQVAVGQMLCQRKPVMQQR